MDSREKKESLLFDKYQILRMSIYCVPKKLTEIYSTKLKANFFFFIVYVLFALELHLGRAQVLQRKGPIKVHQGKRTQIRQQLPVVVIRLARVPPPPVRVLPEHVLQRDRCSLGFANALPLVLGGRPIGL